MYKRQVGFTYLRYFIEKPKDQNSQGSQGESNFKLANPEVTSLLENLRNNVPPPPPPPPPLSPPPPPKPFDIRDRDIRARASFDPRFDL